MILNKNPEKNLKIMKEKLEIVFQKYNQNSFLDSDPIGIVHEYEDFRDQELVAFISSTFSFGNVTYIRKTLKKILAKLGEHPVNTLLNMSYQKNNVLFKNCSYRWINSDAIEAFILILSSVFKKYGSLENYIRSGLNISEKEIQQLRSFLLET